MLAITKSKVNRTGPDLEYWGRTIHLGASLKSVEYDWDEWRFKFENLLKKLYWTEAQVHYKTESLSLFSFEWRLDLNKWNFDIENPTNITEDYWNFTNVNKWHQ